MSFVFILFFAVFLFFAENVFAVTTMITNFPSTVSSDPFTLDVKITGASAGTNYLRIDLYKAGTTNYFAETFNGTNWYSEANHTQYYPISIQSGSDWTGQIQGRFGNPTLAQYDNPGVYKMRVRRYTSSGSYNTTEANNSTVDVNINVSFPTVTPSEVPSDTPTSTLVAAPTEAPTNTPVESSSATPTSSPQSYSNIFLSEAIIDPESGGNEWIEIYNGNDFSVSLDNWFVDDIESAGSTAKKFSLAIPAKSYGVYELTTSIFNNDGDSVRLLDFSQSEKDSFQYQPSEKGKTLGRTSFDSDTFCLQNPSKGAVNSSCLHPSATPTPKITPSSTLTPTRTPTLTPTKKVTPTRTPTKVKPKAIPTKFPLFIQSKVSSTKKQDEVYQGNILGAETKEQSSAKSRNPLLTSLLFASFSFAILAIISIAIKTKIWKKFKSNSI